MALAAQLIAALERRRGSGAAAPPERAAAEAADHVAAVGATRAVMADDPWLRGLGVAEALSGGGVEVLWWPTGHDVRELLGLDGPEATVGITVPVAAAAERGTLVLAAGAGHGRAIDVASMHHLALLPAERLVPSLAGALDAVYGHGGVAPSAVSLVSGPSRTSDIEKVSTLGAHGALDLHVIVVAEASPGGR